MQCDLIRYSKMVKSANFSFFHSYFLNQFAIFYLLIYALPIIFLLSEWNYGFTYVHTHNYTYMLEILFQLPIISEFVMPY